LKEILSSLETSINKIGTQKETEATLAPKLTPQLAQIDWESQSAVEIYNLYRGLAGFHKLFTFYEDKKVDLDQFGLVQRKKPHDLNQEHLNERTVNSKDNDKNNFVDNKKRDRIKSENVNNSKKLNYINYAGKNMAAKCKIHYG